MAKEKVVRLQVTLIAALCATTAVACGGGSPLQQGFKAGRGLQGDAARTLIERIQRSKRPETPFAVVGVTGRGLVGQLLPDGRRWEYSGPLDTLPVLSGGFIAISGGGEVTLLDLATGKVQWKVSSEGRQLSSMTHDGHRALIVLTDPDDSRVQLLMTIDANGTELNRARSEPAIGRSAAVDGMAIVPWGGRYLTVVDLAGGQPLGRFVVDNAVTAVRMDPNGALLFGDGVIPLDLRALGSARPAPLRLPAKNLPGSPRWPLDGTVTLQPQGMPIALHAHPIIGPRGVQLAHDTFASTYYRVVLGFGAHYGELRWSTYFQRDVLGGATSEEGLSLCLQDGSVWRLGWQDGSRSSAGSLKTRLRACVLSADRRPVEAARPVPLAEQVASTLTDTGPDMAPAHQLLLDELAANPSPEVTRLLVEIARSPRAAADLASHAARRVSERRTGAEYLLAALKDSMEFDVAKRPAPLGAIASALYAMGERDAAGPLAHHLVDPRTTMADQLVLARVLRELASAEQVPQLTEYFTLYRTAASEPELAQAVLLTAETLWNVGGEEGREIVVDAARDPMTHPNVRTELERLIANAGSEDQPGSDTDSDD